MSEEAVLMATVGELTVREMATLALELEVPTNVLAAFLREPKLREPHAEYSITDINGDRELLITFEFGDLLELRRGADFDKIMAMGGHDQYCTIIPRCSIRDLNAVLAYVRLQPGVEMVESRDLRRVIAARTQPLYARIKHLRANPPTL